MPTPSLDYRSLIVLICGSFIFGSNGGDDGLVIVMIQTDGFGYNLYMFLARVEPIHGRWCVVSSLPNLCGTDIYVDAQEKCVEP